MLLRILDDLVIRHLHVALTSGHFTVICRRHQLPQRHGLETMQSRILTRGLGPGCVGLEDILSVDVSLKVIPELLISTLACTSFLDTAFEGVVLVATFDPGLDRAAAGETVELGGNIGFEILVNFLVAIVGPDSLRRYQLESGRP